MWQRNSKHEKAQNHHNFLITTHSHTSPLSFKVRLLNANTSRKELIKKKLKMRDDEWWNENSLSSHKHHLIIFSLISWIHTEFVSVFDPKLSFVSLVRSFFIVIINKNLEKPLFSCWVLVFLVIIPVSSQMI